jgi:hypothetical protein
MGHIESFKDIIESHSKILFFTGAGVSTLSGIPDFRSEECRKEYENDRLTPFYGSDGSKPNIPCCSHPDYKPSERQMELYFEELKK